MNREVSAMEIMTADTIIEQQAAAISVHEVQRLSHHRQRSVSVEGLHVPRLDGNVGHGAAQTHSILGLCALPQDVALYKNQSRQKECICCEQTRQ